MDRHPDGRIRRVIDLFEALTRDDLPRLAEHYTSDARFKDPFNDVQGVDAIERIFAHMFDTLDEPRFVIRDAIAEGDLAFLSWDFSFRSRRFARDGLLVRGGTQLRFAADGRIAEHRDYWDPAEELYEKLPLIGAPMRWLRRRASASRP